MRSLFLFFIALPLFAAEPAPAPSPAAPPVTAPPAATPPTPAATPPAPAPAPAPVAKPPVAPAPAVVATPTPAPTPPPPPPAPTRGNQLLNDYFEREVGAVEAQAFFTPKTAEEWNATRLAGRKQLSEMLGLDPMPARTPLNVTKTGEVEGEGFRVENLHFQSMPGLYVTANCYRPSAAGKPGERLPAILYVCGHSDVKAKDGGSLGNKTYYQHHGEWFARHGYVCLVIDTVQLGEIRGEHHGTYSQGRWWWFSRGYTPAGVEAWNGIRSLDYLESRPDVDPARIGLTGRSGGGAYSWWVAALDDRVKVVAPTAGITTLRNYVVDGAVEGHCDCMFMVNTYRWDYDRVAALIAPRPLLICNTDKDTIFPLDGVMNVYTHVRRLYRALGAENKIGLQISEGPHKDTQPLNSGAFAWFERYLKGADPMALLDEPAQKRLDPEVLRVFKELPKDELNTKIDTTFVKAAGEVPLPENAAAFAKQRDAWMSLLREKVFGGWPVKAPDLVLTASSAAEHEGLVMRAWDFTPQEPWALRLYVLHRTGLKSSEIEHLRLKVLGDSDWPAFQRMMPGHFPEFFSPQERTAADGKDFVPIKAMLLAKKDAVAFIAPRGIGPTAWTGDEKQQTHRLRRFYLLGQTLDGMRVWDIRAAIGLLRAQGYVQPLDLLAEGSMAGNALYASLFEEGIARVTLWSPPASHAVAPIYLNVLRYLDLPQAAAMATSRTKVRIITGEKAAWNWTTQTAAKLGRADSLEFAETAPQE